MDTLLALVPAGVFSGSFTQALSHGKLWAYIFVFLGGILTSFTPCIFPMIPITISIIGAKAAHNHKSKAFFLSLAYVLGIAITYSLLGVLAATTGAFFGSLLGNIWVVGFVSLVFAVMGLSMLGLFELQAPSFIRNTIGTTHAGSGFFGAFAAGLISGIVASPCIGPVLVGILTYVAQTAQVFFGFTLLFTFAIGMGLIFIVLGTFSGLLSKLPRAGSWMNKTKIVFGLALIFMAVYYTKPFWPSQKIAAKTYAQKMNWQKFNQEAIQLALTKKQKVILDFGADWCVACHELEEKTYTDSKVIEATKNFLLLKFDATHETPESEAVQKEYGVVGLPTVIFIDSAGKILTSLNVTGFVDAKEFLNRIEKVK